MADFDFMRKVRVYTKTPHSCFYKLDGEYLVDDNDKSLESFKKNWRSSDTLFEIETPVRFER